MRVVFACSHFVASRRKRPISGHAYGIMPESKVTSRARAARAKFIGKRSREGFAGALGDRRQRVRAGGDNLGYFTTNPDFGQIGEIAVVSGAKLGAVSDYFKASCGKSAVSSTPPTFTTA
jgi:hypothetical protein